MSNITDEMIEKVAREADPQEWRLMGKYAAIKDSDEYYFLAGACEGSLNRARRYLEASERLGLLQPPEARRK